MVSLLLPLAGDEWPAPTLLAFAVALALALALALATRRASLLGPSFSFSAGHWLATGQASAPLVARLAEAVLFA